MINRLPKDFVVIGPATQPRTTTLEPQAEAPPNLSTRALNAAAKGIGGRPVASLAIAFVLGLAIGKLVKR